MKTKFIKVFSIFITVILVFVSLPAVNIFAVDIVDSGACGDDLAWTPDGEGMLSVNETVELELKEGEIAYFAFTPSVSGKYTFRAYSECDTYGELYNADMELLTTDDDGANDKSGNFSITYDLEAGKKYYFSAKFYSSYDSGRFRVGLICDETYDHIHLYTEKVTKPPTCTQDGEKTFNCICGDFYKEIINATGHTEVIDNALQATCTTAGKTEGKHCSVCGTVTVKQTVIPTTGHKSVAIKAIPATCTTAGKTAGTKCSVCGKVLTAQKTVPATGHKSVAIKATPAICTTAGKTAGTKCSVCGKILTAQKTVPATGHTYTTTTTKATMSKNGSIVTKCKTCGAVKSNVAIAKVSTVKLNKSTLEYTGKAQKPTVTVKDSKGKTLKQGTDYTVSYSKGCKNIGQYTVTVTFKGNYSGTKKLTFTIVPKGTSISKLTAGKKQFTANWKKQSTQTNGYEIQYSTSSKMKNAKTVTIGKAKTTSTTVKNLKSGKTYYVRIRTFKTVKINGKSVKLYSPWSSVKSVKVK